MTASAVVSSIVAEPRAAASSAGSGQAVVRVVRADRRSVVTQAYATSPLRLLTPSNHGHAAWIFASSLGGGLVDGDRLAMRITVEDGAAAYLSTQASTKVYKSRRGTASDLCAVIGRNALLVVCPDPIVCFADARYSQLQQYDVASSGGLIVLDWFTSGRHRSGERWAFAQYESRMIIRVDGRELVHDAMALRAVDGGIARRLGRFDVVATLAMVGSAVADEVSAVAARANVAPVVVRAPQLAATTVLPGGGCVIRIAGTSLESVAATIRDLLSFLPGRLGDSPWQRKW